MVTIGIDAHKRSHTIVIIDEQGRQLAARTIGTTSVDHFELVAWTARFASRRWAVEDCRHLSRRLERDLLAAGERIVRVPPKLMANTRTSSRSFGKSDPIDALAVARAALREPDLPVARLDGVERDVRLLVDHREDLVSEPTRMISRLRWHLHELDPGNEPLSGRSIISATSTGSPRSSKGSRGPWRGLLESSLTAAVHSLSRSTSWNARSPHWSSSSLRRCSRSAAAARSRPRKSSPRQPASNASRAPTHTPDTTAVRPYRSGHRTDHATD
jgi:hypothetical protein